MAVLDTGRAAEHAAPEALDAGVIRDARARQQRQLGIVIAGVAFAIIIGLALYAAYAGGAAARSTVPRPGATTGSLRPLPPAVYQYWITPDLRAGEVSLDYRLTFATGISGASSASCECDNYPGSTRRSIEWFPQGLGLTMSSGPGASSTTPNNEVVFVAGNVAALRVGHSGEVGAQAAPNLPPGDKLAAFQLAVPRKPNPQFARLSALDNRGDTLANTNGPGANGLSAPPASTRSGACAIRADVPGIQDEGSRSVTVVHALPATLPGIFLTCLQDFVSLDGANLQIAILLNAHHPGQPPAGLWGSTPLPGHPGVVELKAPSLFTFNVDTGSPMLARRAGNAWIIVAGRPALPPAPSMRARLQTLEETSIIRLDLSK
jgi:hypothetical protein